MEKLYFVVYIKWEEIHLFRLTIHKFTIYNKVFQNFRISLVNKSVVNYFLADLKIEEHFRALRSFIFMQDGEFGQTLSDQLFEKVQNSFYE